jgi:acyl-CoA dehydrogenase family protein 9
MMRDARINQIGEGANDVLRSFIAVVGAKPVADQLMNVKNALTSNPFKDIGSILSFGRKQIGHLFSIPEVPVRHASLRAPAAALAKRIHEFGGAVQGLLFRYRESFLERQYQHERLSDAACEIYASSCALSRLDALASSSNGNGGDLDRDIRAGQYFMKLSDRRIRQCLIAMQENDDEATTQVADAFLR